MLRRIPLTHNTRAYDLTPRGLALGEDLDALRQWGEGIT